MTRCFHRLQWFLTSFLLASLPAQSYLGSGGRHGQQIAAIQRNSTLAPTGFVTVANSSSFYRTVSVRFQADTARTITGYDLLMRSTTGPLITYASLQRANAQGAPGVELSNGTIGIGTQFSWCRASLILDYRVSAGSSYCLSFDLPPGHSVDLRVADGGPSTNVTYFRQATATPATAKLMYRVNADGRLVSLWPGPLAMGQTQVYTCSGVDPYGPAYLIIGNQRLQTDVASLGLPGSFLWTSTDNFAAVAWADGAGDAVLPFFIPNDPTLHGVTFNAQALAWAPSNPAGFALSNAWAFLVP